MNMIRIRPRLVAGPAAVLAGVLFPPVASAQLEEVTVTAQKREQSLQDVGISISALSAEDLQDLHLRTSADVAQHVPGMQLVTWTPAFTIFSLRGVSQNNFQDNLEAPVAVYWNGAYVASMNAINAQLFDMDRVEVLRGPQGTLFGRNATGGLIQFITRKATATELNGYASVGAAEFGTYDAETAVGGALSDHVRGRIASRWETSDGYIKPGTALGRTATGGDSAGANGFAVRGSLQIDASEALLVDLTAAYSRDHHVPTGEYVVSFAGFNPVTGLGAFTNAIDPANPNAGPTNFSRTPITGSGWRHWSDENPFFDRNVRSLTAQLTAKLPDDLELVSISSGFNMGKDYIEDAGGGFGFFPYVTKTKFDQISEEIRLSRNVGAFRWQVGAYYLDMTWDTFQSIQGALILSGATGSSSDTQLMSTFGKIDSKNKSLFGQAEIDLSPQWTLIGGVRWSQDDKRLKMRRVYEDTPEGVAPVEVFNIADVPIPGIDRIDYGDYAARAQINWRPLERSLFYLAFNRGIKGGNWSLDTLGAVSDEALKHRPEKLKATEIGWKVDFLGGRARLNSAVYYYDYKDYQAFSMVGLTPQVTNSDARSKGGEIELALAPVRRLELTVGASFIDSHVDAVPDVFGGTVEAEFPAAPRVSVNVLTRYAWPALGGTLAAQVDGKWNDDQYLEGTNSEVSFEPAYSVWNASLAYRTNSDALDVSVWVKNLANRQYRLYDLDLGLLGFIEQAYAPPRQYGITAAYRW